jgi:hypothetical protein
MSARYAWSSQSCSRTIIAVTVAVSLAVALAAVGGVLFWLQKKGTLSLFAPSAARRHCTAAEEELQGS